MVTTPFDAWLSESISRAEKIESSSLKGEAKLLIMDRAIQPFGLWKGTESRREEPESSLVEIANRFMLTIKGDELLFPKGGLDNYAEAAEAVKPHGYKYGGKGSYKFVRTD